MREVFFPRFQRLRTGITATTKSRLFILVALLAFAADCQSAPTPTAARTPTPTATPAPEFWSEKGLALTAGDFGHPEINGQLSFADSEIVGLPDGRLRIYMGIGSPNGSGPGFGIGSMVSSDGLHWTLEPGNRCSQTCGQIGVVQMPGGGWRIFGGGEGGIHSATSADGLKWVDEPGLRVSNSTFPGTSGEFLSGPHLTAVSGGGWRMYFHKGAQSWFPGSTLPSPRILSAFSTDLVNWTPDPGVRATGLQHPDVKVLPGGGYQMFGHAGFEIVTAFSQDGLNWPATFSRTYLQGGDPDPLLLPDGRVRLYYNEADAIAKQGGGLFWAELENATWDAAFATGIQIFVSGSGGPVTVRVTDRGRSQDRPLAGLPYTSRPPFRAGVTLPQSPGYQPLIELSDGVMNRYFDPNNLPGSSVPVPIACAGSGFITPCPLPDSCGAGTSTPCPIPCGSSSGELPCGVVRNAPPCQTGQPVGRNGCIVTNAIGKLEYCPPSSGVSPNGISDACKPFYQNSP